MMPPEVRNIVKKIVDLSKFRFDRMPYADKLYNYLLSVIKRMEKKYEYTGL